MHMGPDAETLNASRKEERERKDAKIASLCTSWRLAHPEEEDAITEEDESALGITYYNEENIVCVKILLPLMMVTKHETLDFMVDADRDKIFHKLGLLSGAWCAEAYWVAAYSTICARRRDRDFRCNLDVEYVTLHEYVTLTCFVILALVYF